MASARNDTFVVTAKLAAAPKNIFESLTLLSTPAISVPETIIPAQIEAVSRDRRTRAAASEES
ncbi:MAG: hypothetical protein ACI88G_000800 [Woeseiaceae bacterium]